MRRNLNSKLRIERPSRGWLSAIGVVNAVIWGAALALAFATPPRYTSSWKLILPGSEPEARVSLQNVGQASASSRSFYDGRALDHRVNYREIARSAPVLAVAAEPLGLEWKDLRGQRVRLVDQSSIIKFEITAPTPKQAQDRGWALYRSLQARLQQLREDELAERKLATEQALEEARAKMEEAFDRLEQFKSNSGLVSDEQVDGIVRTTLELQSLRVQTGARLALAEARLEAVAGNLHLTPESAAEAVVLLSDRVYARTLEGYSESRAALDASRGRWGPNHPQRNALEQRVDGTRASLVEIASGLLGRSVQSDEIDLLNRIADPREATSSFEMLTEALADSRSLRAEAVELETREREIRARFGELGRQQLQLENLERRLTLTEAIFNSTLGKADVGRLSVFSSYPLVQLLTEPGLPDVPSWPRRGLLALGAAAASSGVTVGMFLLWFVVPAGQARLLAWVGPEAVDEEAAA